MNVLKVSSVFYAVMGLLKLANVMIVCGNSCQDWVCSYAFSGRLGKASLDHDVVRRPDEARGCVIHAVIHDRMRDLHVDDCRQNQAGEHDDDALTVDQ